jgi:hypothetical protein
MDHRGVAPPSGSRFFVAFERNRIACSFCRFRRCQRRYGVRLLPEPAPALRILCKCASSRRIAASWSNGRSATGSPTPPLLYGNVGSVHRTCLTYRARLTRSSSFGSANAGPGSANVTRGTSRGRAKCNEKVLDNPFDSRGDLASGLENCVYLKFGVHLRGDHAPRFW